MKRKHTSAIAAAAAVALSAAIAVPTLTSAQAPNARTITLQERIQTAVGDDVAPKSKRGPIMSPNGRVSAGDRLVTRQGVFDSAGKRIGLLYTDCTGVGPTKPLFQGARLLCTVTYKLPDGEIVAAGAPPGIPLDPVRVVVHQDLTSCCRPPSVSALRGHLLVHPILRLGQLRHLKPAWFRGSGAYSSA